MTSPSPPWARQKHRLETPRLLLRGAVPEDAEAFERVVRDEGNSPFGGVVGRERSLEEQRQSLIKQQESTARGDNAWLVVILKPGQEELISQSNLSPAELTRLSVPEGHLIGSTGYNEFVLKPNPTTHKEELITDTGALIHHPFTHHGLAMETLQAVISYAFVELRCDVVTLETDAVNLPFRGLMGSLGLGHSERPGSNGQENANEDVKQEEKKSIPTTPLPTANLLGGRNHPLSPKPGPKPHIKQGALLPPQFQPPPSPSEPEPKEQPNPKPKQDNGLGSNPSVKFSFGISDWEDAKKGLKERGRWYID